VRDKEGVVKLPAEVHSVTLYKNPTDAVGNSEVIVIDPSNFTYSSHLSNPDILSPGDKSTSHVKHANLSTISTFHKSIQIYKPAEKKPVGPAMDQYRDCVDIAVKTAFQWFDATYTIDVTKIDQELVVIKLSNTGVDESFSVTDAPVRVKQSTSTHHVNAFYALEASLSKKVALLNFCKKQANDRLATYSDSVLKDASELDGGALLTRLESISTAKRATHGKRYEGIIKRVEDSKEELAGQLRAIKDHDGYLDDLGKMDLKISGEISKLYGMLDLE
jgi:hypothetical protein